jgi:hypothetical protein
MLDQLTAAELDQLAAVLHRGTMHALDEVTSIQLAMSQTQTWKPAYEAMAARSNELMAMGSEASMIFAEVNTALRCRLAA